MPNTVAAAELPSTVRQDFVFAAARWWDEGKGGALLDAAAGRIGWPVQAAGACRGPKGQAFHFAHAQAPGPLPHAGRGADAPRGDLRLAVPLRAFRPCGAGGRAGGGGALVLADVPTYREI
ncbi:hypothetical protein [Falsiroseomonas tokyonensis]|uniref:Uncharacterized protein n=1 Tax=Falsiroseomonas tokyonensis TaxID=430521 RepID=A0ABV7BPJ0_9PROT|nr:hypothetical protein [Falsiroseomonas tokyonensis]MBU8536749.1 hypothetical protein [Falsiroseomonas tokyonensis]